MLMYLFIVLIACGCIGNDIVCVGDTALGDILSFLQIDGFEQDKKVVVIAATNRKQDLDPALIR